MAHANSKFVCHAVHTIFTADFEDEWAADEPRKSKLVFIGKGLVEAELAAAFNDCLATPENYARRSASLRFAVGEQVEFRGGPDEWVDATVVSHWFYDDDEDDMPLGHVAPYEIQRHDDEAGFTTWADYDTDVYIRRQGWVPEEEPPPAAGGAEGHGDGGGGGGGPHHGHEHGHVAKAQKMAEGGSPHEVAASSLSSFGAPIS